jgi:hypothetical protein
MATACGGGAKTAAPPKPRPVAPPVVATAEPEPPPAPSEPWPAPKASAAWSVVDWTMNDHDAEEALKAAGLTPQRLMDPSGRVVSVDVASAMTGWKATVTFDESSGKVSSVIVRGDPVTIEAAQSARARLEGRFGAPKETKIHRSRQWGKKAVEIEGDKPSWRITQSLMREGKEKGAVEWPSLALTWGMSPAAVSAAMKASGYSIEKTTPALTASAPAAKNAKKGRSKAKTLASSKPPLPPGAPRGAKVVELAFKKAEERVVVSIVDKTGLFKIGVGQDVADRNTAEQRAALAAKGLGAALSEAETETSIWHDAKADVRLTITGFQGQRIVVETYQSPETVEE